MVNYIETQTKDNSSILIEVAEDARGTAGFGRQTETGNVLSEAATDAYRQTLETIRTCADGVIDTIQSLETQPSTASIEFGIKIDAKAGAMISKTLSEGQFKVSLSWKQPEPEDENNKN